MPAGDAYTSSQKHVLGANRGVMDPSDEKEATAIKRKALDTSSEHIEDVGTSEKVGKRQKAKRHLRRFWCCYLMAGIIFLAIFLPILFVDIH